MPPPDLTANTLPAQSLPPLDRIKVTAATSQVSPPVKRIQTEEDLAAWKQSDAHRHVSLFVARLGEAAVGKETQWPERGEKALSPGVQAVVELLETLDAWTREIEPKKTPQRFGNTAFRDWGARLEEKNASLHQRLLSSHPHLQPFIPELTAYLADSFGSFVRIDYGSGHEVNFLAWLAYLARLGFFEASQTAQPSQTAASSSKTTAGPVASTAEETQLALVVLPLYLEVVWGLQDRYALEPAGSHGVWGLDDYQFVPYIIGAAQLRLQLAYRPSHFSQPSHKPPRRLNAAELLTFVPSRDSPPFANLFTSSIARIHSLKTGPFFEHSPLLNDIASSVPNWKKVHSGMSKMWDNEVMGKRPVVQHFVFGGVGYRWQGELGAAQVPTATTATTARAPTTAASVQPPTMAPWARSGAPAPSISASSLGPRVAGAGRTQAAAAAAAASRPPADLPGATKAPWAK